MKRFLMVIVLLITGCGSDRTGVSDSPKDVAGVSQRDSDGDGIIDSIELNMHHTDPFNADSDSDGLDDGKEINLYETNASNPDTDGDGLKDGEEIYTYETNATNVDTDNDGLKDGEEVHTYETNAINPDTDGDCLLDSFEILNYETNATNPDTDSDKVNDGIELFSYRVDELNVSCLSNPETLMGGYNANPPKDGIPDMDTDIINALDPTNDSDGDGQSNSRENNCSQGDPLDKSKICLFETDSEEGKILLDYGYAYVPGGFDVDGDGKKEGGFWMSRYQARESGIVIPSETISEIIGNINQYISKEFRVVNKNVQLLSYDERVLTEQEITAGNELLFKETDVAGEQRISSYTPLLAQACLSKYHLTDSKGDNLDINVTMPTMKQYLQVKMLLDADFKSGGDGRHIRNGLLGIDPNVPLATFSLVIEEFGETHKEFVKNIIQLRDIHGADDFNSLRDIPKWWDVNSSKIEEFKNGATSGTNIGQGTGPESDMYGVVVRGGDILDVRISVTATESDGQGNTNGISFRAATGYLY